MEVDDDTLFKCRSVEETEDILDKWCSDKFVDSSNVPASQIFMSFNALRGDVYKMYLELEEFMEANIFADEYEFEKETFLYAAIMDYPDCLEFAFQNGSIECFKELYGIIPRCIMMGHDECLRVALKHHEPFGWWPNRMYYVDPFKFVWQHTCEDLPELWGRVRCFRLLLDNIAKMQRIKEKLLALEEFGYLEEFGNCIYIREQNINELKSWPKFAKHVLWKIFRINVRHRMILNYWIKMTGESTCAPDGVARKRHFEEFENAFC